MQGQRGEGRRKEKEGQTYEDERGGREWEGWLEVEQKGF